MPEFWNKSVMNTENNNNLVKTNTVICWKSFCDDEKLSPRNMKRRKIFCAEEHRAFGPINLYGGLSIKVAANSENKEIRCRNNRETQRGKMAQMSMTNTHI